MELPEIPDFTKPEIEIIIDELIIAYFKDYPNFFYIDLTPAGMGIALPIEKLEELIEELNSIIKFRGGEQ